MKEPESLIKCHLVPETDVISIISLEDCHTFCYT